MSGFSFSREKVEKSGLKLSFSYARFSNFITIVFYLNINLNINAIL